MLIDIIKYCITTTIGIVITSLVAYIKFLKKQQKTKRETESGEKDNLIEATKILLRGELIKDCRYFISQGHISEQEYQELEASIKVYENAPFNGNGLVHKLFAQINNIEIR